ncbi:hypothetical protein [Desulfovibrio inopinatus]|uniref:hypothetical protein n=1 Tax=Desulfovibrio inopinatus TaxID=102109 RepID=UPI0003FEBB4C|nr:hypothetical protein [Desulfovibrio inopinatus]
MKRLACIMISLMFLAISCSSSGPWLYHITPEDVASEPTVYAKVITPPNPELLGFWRRDPPTQFNKPHTFDYWLIKKGDKYAVYYYWKDPKHGRTYDGWAPFVINGDTMRSTVDASKFFYKDGKVWHNWAGREFDSPMRLITK